MAISPDAAAELARRVLVLYLEAELILLERVAKRLMAGVDREGWAEQKLAQVSAMRGQAQAVVRALERTMPGEVDDAVRKAWELGAGEALSELAGLSISLTGVVTREPPPSVTVLVRETITRLSATHVRILRVTEDVYRSTIAEAAPQVLTGTQTRREATQRALNRFADQGVTGFTDRAGRNWSLEGYAEMATRAATGRAAIDGHLQRLTDHGQDLVVISDAPEECELCRPHEGKVYSISGTSTEHPPLAIAIAEGLFHPGCRHTVGIFIPGVTRRSVGTADPIGNDEREVQRYLERGVRRWKRRAAVGDPAAAAKVREWQARLKDFVEDNDRKRLRYREQIGRSGGGGGPTPPEPPKPPEPEPRPGPSGTPVSSALRVEVQRKHEAATQDVLRAIDEVHGDGDLPEIPLKTNNRMKLLGRYRYIISQSGNPSLDIAVKYSPSNPHPLLTLAHEIGHFLDHKGIGDDPAQHESLRAPGGVGVLVPWLEAVRASAAYARIQEIVSTRKLPDGTSAHMPYARYQLRTEELWARSYAQYIATKASHQGLRGQLKDALENHNEYGQQWEEADFEPIEKAIDDLFERLGWRIPT